MADSRLLTPQQIEETAPGGELDRELNATATALSNAMRPVSRATSMMVITTNALVSIAIEGGVTRADLLEYVGEWFDAESKEIN